MQEAPALRLFFIATAEQIGEATCDIVHFSLFIRIIGMTIDVECREEVSVTCVVLYLLHCKRRIIGEEADTGVPESVELDVRKMVLIKQLSKIMRYTIWCYKCSDSVHANKILVGVSLPYHNLLLRFQSLKVAIKSIVHREAADE